MGLGVFSTLFFLLLVMASSPLPEKVVASVFKRCLRAKLCI